MSFALDGLCVPPSAFICAVAAVHIITPEPLQVAMSTKTCQPRTKKKTLLFFIVYYLCGGERGNVPYT